jgi:hypothetical protein
MFPASWLHRGGVPPDGTAVDVERTWEPTSGETIRGTWRTSGRGAASGRPAPWFAPYLEIDDGIRLLLPSRRTLNAALRELKPRDGLTLSITYHGTDAEGEELYVVSKDAERPEAAKGE